MLTFQNKKGSNNFSEKLKSYNLNKQTFSNYLRHAWNIWDERLGRAALVRRKKWCGRRVHVSSTPPDPLPRVRRIHRTATSFKPEAEMARLGIHARLGSFHMCLAFYNLCLDARLDSVYTQRWLYSCISTACAWTFTTSFL